MKVLNLKSENETYSTCLERNNIDALYDLSPPEDIYRFTNYFILSARVAIKLNRLGASYGMFVNETIDKYLYE